MENRSPNAEPTKEPSAISAEELEMVKAQRNRFDRERKRAEEKVRTLEAENREMKEALKDIATVDADGVCDSGYSAGHVARKALKESPDA